MGIGIQICGLNGSGKSTIGRALADVSGLYFIDNENLYFSRKDEKDVYTNARSREEVEKLLKSEVEEHNNFIFAAVKGDYGKEIVEKYRYVILVEVPKEIRSQRVRGRSFSKFGNRMLPGGDLYEQEEAFFQMVEVRNEDYVEKWIQTLHCPVIRVDGTKSVQENVEFIIREIGRLEKKNTKLEIIEDGIWYHGSNRVFAELNEGSTITQWRELAEAFSHKPTTLGYDDDGTIFHNGTEKGYLYVIDEPIRIGQDIYQHPRTTMDENAEFLTKRPLKVRLVMEVEK